MDSLALNPCHLPKSVMSFDYPCFTNEENEARRGAAIVLKPYNKCQIQDSKLDLTSKSWMLPTVRSTCCLSAESADHWPHFLGARETWVTVSLTSEMLFQLPHCSDIGVQIITPARTCSLPLSCFSLFFWLQASSLKASPFSFFLSFFLFFFFFCSDELAFRIQMKV